MTKEKPKRFFVRLLLGIYFEGLAFGLEVAKKHPNMTRKQVLTTLRRAEPRLVDKLMDRI